MANRRKINFNGQMIEAELVDFEAEKESWSNYILHDGSSVKIKVVVTEVARLLGMYQANGDPVYMVQASQVMSVNAPENLRKQG